MADTSRPSELAPLAPDTGAEAPRVTLAAAGADVAPRASTSIWRRFRRHRLALIGMTILVLLTVGAIGAPVIARHGPYKVDLRSYRKPPNAQHWLGTDAAGRDVFSRLLYAGRVSLSVGLVAVSIYTAIGLVLGALAGFFGGWVDAVVMRLADVFLAFPSLIIIITMVSVLGPSVYNVMLAIGLLGWPPITRLLRGDLLSLRERDFVIAARAVGAPNHRIIIRHLLPNALAPIIVAATFGIAAAILLEAGLSFLGLGVQPPTADWGAMVAEGRVVLRRASHVTILPGIMILAVSLAFNFLGDGIRDALDPRTIRR